MLWCRYDSDRRIASFVFASCTALIAEIVVTDWQG